MSDYRPAQPEQKSKSASDTINLELLNQISSQQQMMVNALHEVVGWLNGKVTKTEVINQLKSISTPDVDKVVEAVKHLDATVSSQTFDTSKLEQALADVKLEKVTVTNLSDLDKRLDAITQAVKGIKFDPIIDVKAPEARVTVKSESFAPLQAAMLEVVQAIKEIEMPEAPESEPINAFISEKFDEYRIEFFDDNDDMPLATHYYLEGKKVATVKYSYNRAGNLVGAKKV